MTAAGDAHAAGRSRRPTARSRCSCRSARRRAVRAVAEGIGSQTRTVTVVSPSVRIKVAPRRARRHAAACGPQLPGRVLLLRGGAVRPTATAKPRDGRFRIRLPTPVPAATRPSSSRPASAPSGPPRTPESSDEPPAAGAARRARRAGGARRRRRASRPSTASVRQIETRLGAGLEPQTRYVVTNHGFTYVLRRPTARPTSGMINYKVVPRAYRDTLTRTGPAGARATPARRPHATCAASPRSRPRPRSWRGRAPTRSTTTSLPEGRGRPRGRPRDVDRGRRGPTGVDLATADPATSCAAKGGTYTPADETLSTAKALAAGQSSRRPRR